MSPLDNGGPRRLYHTTNQLLHIQRFSPAAAVAYIIQWTRSTTIPPEKAVTALMIIKPMPTVQSPPPLKEQQQEQ